MYIYNRNLVFHKIFWKRLDSWTEVVFISCIRHSGIDFSLMINYWLKYRAKCLRLSYAEVQFALNIFLALWELKLGIPRMLGHTRFRNVSGRDITEVYR